MDTCTAIAAYATETGYLIRGLLVIVAMGMVFAWRQGRKLRRTGLALQDSRRMASAAQQRVRELEQIGVRFEGELKRVDAERALFKDALRGRQRLIEDQQSEIEALRVLVRQASRLSTTDLGRPR